MADMLKLMFPYGMEKADDGTWCLFNRNYERITLDASSSLKFKSLRRPTLISLDVNGATESGRVFFYDDGTVPSHSAKNMNEYLSKLRLLMGLQVYD